MYNVMWCLACAGCIKLYFILQCFLQLVSQHRAQEKLHKTLYGAKYLSADKFFAKPLHKVGRVANEGSTHDPIWTTLMFEGPRNNKKSPRGIGPRIILPPHRV